MHGTPVDSIEAWCRRTLDEFFTTTGEVEFDAYLAPASRRHD